MPPVTMRWQSVSREPAFTDRGWSTTDGIELYARDYGAGEGRARLPVICLHGMTRNSADFEDLAPVLAATHRRVVVPDMRGRGRSGYDPKPHNYHLLTYAGDIIDLLGHLGIGHAHVIGTSMGGLIAMLVAMQRPGLIKSVVLNDVGPYLSAEGLMRLAGHAVHPAAFASWDEAAAFVRAQNAPAFPHLDDAAWLAFARRLCRQTPAGGIELAFDPEIFRPLTSPKGAPFVFDMSPAYLSLAAGHILVVRGELSDVLDKAGVYRMQGLTRRFNYVEVKGVGHAPTLMEPEARAAIEAFLAEMP